MLSGWSCQPDYCIDPTGHKLCHANKQNKKLIHLKVLGRNLVFACTTKWSLCLWEQCDFFSTTLFLAFSVVLHLMLLLLNLSATLYTNHLKHVKTSYIVLRLTFSVCNSVWGGFWADMVMIPSLLQPFGHGFIFFGCVLSPSIWINKFPKNFFPSRLFVLMFWKVFGYCPTL
jgi:hypothetical protein